jgi:hypothetical protein
MDIKFINNDLHDNDWIGVVINNEDPTFSGRAKVRVVGVMDGIQDEHVPWAVPITGDVYGLDGAGMMSVPKLGSWCRVQFCNGDLYSPEIRAIQNLDTDLIEKIKEDYNDGCHVILHDPVENLSILHLRESGLMIFKNESFFQITPDSMITLYHADGDSIIQMEGDIINVTSKNEVNVTAASKATVNADEVIVQGSQRTKVGPGPYKHAVLAEPMWSLMTQLATALDAKLPPTPGVTVGLVTSAMQAATSTNVLISS